MIGGFVILLSVLSAATAAAQDPPPAVCELNPYPVGGVVQVKCYVETPTTRTVVPPTVFRFGEGVVHAPGSELAWIILTNFDATPQTVTLEFLMQGDDRPIWRTFTVPGYQRLPYALHEDDG